MDRKNERWHNIPLSSLYCYQLGTNAAANGTPLEVIIKQLERDGYRRTGTTVRRVTRAYNEQIARG